MEVTLPHELTRDQLEWLLNNVGEDWKSDWHFVSQYETPHLIHQTVRHLIVFTNESDALLFVLSCL